MSPWQSQVLARLGLGPVWRLRAPREALADEMAMPERGGASAIRAGQGEDTPVEGEPEAANATSVPASPATHVAAVAAASMSNADDDWTVLERSIRECTACVLHCRRKQAVPGVGDRHPRWLLVGEGPGAEEDRRGEPFVGLAGQLLDAMLSAAGLSRHDGAYIANAVKCRPPGNRTPEAAEIATCFPYLRRQVELLAPRLIIALGRPAAQSLLDRELRIADARGKTFQFADIPVVVTYHPAYLLRNPHDKGKAWEDLCRARQLAPPA